MAENLSEMTGATQNCDGHCGVAVWNLDERSSTGLMSWPFDITGFPARWHCGTTWEKEPWLAWMHIISDLIIWFAYMSIPIALAYFILRKRDIGFPRILWLFCAFIAACGTGHFIEAMIFWYPLYRLAGLIKLITAVISLATVAAVIRIVPLALKLPGLAQMNEQLVAENARRREAEERYLELNLNLESSIAKRTAEIERRAVEFKEINAQLQQEMTRREDLQGQLIKASRQAGMADVATGVLHNVGNVLNSVNVSINVVRDKVRNSRVSQLEKAVLLLTEHRRDLATFLSSDERGKMLPEFLALGTAGLVAERDATLVELRSMDECVDHIKKVVNVQQSFASAPDVAAPTPVAELIEDAIKLNDASLDRHGIKVIRKYDLEGEIVTDRHKVLQILINLISNAKQAVMASDRADRQIVLMVVRGGPDRIRLAVADNGIGIPNENLTRIFNHGFTTKQDGHGFGLHAAALAARELRGRLSVVSGGPGSGACFTLELPTKALGNAI